MNRDDLHRRDAERQRAGVPYVGMPTDKGCDICGAHKHNQFETRFCYTVCADHASLTPVEVGEKRNSQAVKRG